MMTNDSLSPVQHIIAAHRRGEAAGLYSVCCSHPSVLRAAMRVAASYDTVLLVEATSNQVDQFGGYTGMTPPQFVAYVQHLAREQHFPLERLVLGGDHLGPNAWQWLDAATAKEDPREKLRQLREEFAARKAQAAASPGAAS